MTNAPSPTPQAPDCFRFDNTYARDLEGFYVPWQPSPAPKPRLIGLNEALCEELGIAPDDLRSPEGLEILAGNRIPAGAEPLAQAYAGHQFGGFSPQLGDGRALLLGEVIDRHGLRRDIAFKGSGQTPFSRNGDGKCALGPALREYLIGEAMAALGIPTTRALAVVATGDQIWRDRPLPGAVLTRVAASHLRVGTFEFCAVHRGLPQLKRLADYAIARHDPQLATHPQPYLALLNAVAERQAALIARWLGVGFIHGVMNTDNMTISGETIDYGPCAFMESYDPACVFSSIDRHGRYAYGQQAEIAQWNLARFAETLLPLIDTDTQRAIVLATEVIEAFAGRHAEHWLQVMRTKLGLDGNGSAAVDHALASDFLALIDQQQLDFTLAFRSLYAAAGTGVDPIRVLSGETAQASDWMQRWKARQPTRTPELLAAMKNANPCYIPRNHQVENALDAAVDRMDMQPFERLLGAIRRPCDELPELSDLADPATPEFTAGYQTFCGT